jgi:hypothetical protein
MVEDLNKVGQEEDLHVAFHIPEEDQDD